MMDSHRLISASALPARAEQRPAARSQPRPRPRRMTCSWRVPVTREKRRPVFQRSALAAELIHLGSLVSKAQRDSAEDELVRWN
jgi:hypothetical protein